MSENSKNFQADIIPNTKRKGRATVSDFYAQITQNGIVIKKFDVKTVAKCDKNDRFSPSFGWILSQIRATHIITGQIEEYLISLTHKPEWKKEAEKHVIVAEPGHYNYYDTLAIRNLDRDKTYKVTIEEL